MKGVLLLKGWRGEEGEEGVRRSLCVPVLSRGGVVLGVAMAFEVRSRPINIVWTPDSSLPALPLPALVIVEDNLIRPTKEVQGKYLP